MSQRDKVIEILEAVTKKKYPGDDEESLFDAGFLDSFALTDVVASLEEAFGFKTPDSDLTPRKFASVSKILGYIESR